mmetsp:Transcript_37674/g.120091  ORF Transcript_37674/g.120091 Transcript_37674/m.120091 type:complete len:119 (+) Transcript_37674:475-831(+)
MRDLSAPPPPEREREREREHRRGGERRRESLRIERRGERERGPLPFPPPPPPARDTPFPAQETFTKGMPKSFVWSVFLTASSASFFSKNCTNANKRVPLLERTCTCLISPNLLYSSFT